MGKKRNKSESSDDRAHSKVTLKSRKSKRSKNRVRNRRDKSNTQNNSSDSSDDDINLATLFRNKHNNNENTESNLHQTCIVSCEFCDRVFTNRYDSIKHNARHIIIPLQNQKVFTCNICLFSFTSGCRLKRHIENKHSELNENSGRIDNFNNNYQISEVSENKLHSNGSQSISEPNLSENCSKNAPVLHSSDKYGPQSEISSKNASLHKNNTYVQGNKNIFIRDTASLYLNRVNTHSEMNTQSERNSKTAPNLVNIQHNIVLPASMNGSHGEMILPDLDMAVFSHKITENMPEMFNLRENILTKENRLRSVDIEMSDSNFECDSFMTDLKMEDLENEDIEWALNNIDSIDIDESKFYVDFEEKTPAKTKNVINLKSRILFEDDVDVCDASDVYGCNDTAVFYKDLTKLDNVKCKICGKVFLNRYDLIQHEPTHWILDCYPKNYLVCKYCDVLISGESNRLTEHVNKSHKGETEQNHMLKLCNMCHLPFYNFSNHMQLYHRHFKCQKCHRTFRTSKSLDSHACSDLIRSEFDTKLDVIVKFWGRYKLACAVCAKIRSRENDFKVYLSGKSIKLRNCGFCNKKIFEVYVMEKVYKRIEVKKKITNEQRYLKITQRLKKLKFLNKF